MSREYWINLFIRGVSPSDAIRVRAKDEDTSVLDLKERLLEQIAAILPGKTSVHWITLTCPANEADPVAPVITLQSSQDLVDLPGGAGGKRWHMHADVRLLGDLLPPSAKGAPQGDSRAGGPADTRPLTLFERGIAGPAEPHHIKNALDLRDLYPGGVLPQGAKEEFSLLNVIKAMTVCAILGMGAVALLYFLESRPTQNGVVDELGIPGFQEL